MCLIKELLFSWVRYYYSPTLCTNQHERQQQLQNCGWISELGLGFSPPPTDPTNWGQVKGEQLPIPTLCRAGHSPVTQQENAGRANSSAFPQHSSPGRGRAAFAPHWPRAAAPWQCPSCSPSLAIPTDFWSTRVAAALSWARFEGWEVSRPPRSPGTAEPSARAELELGTSCSSSVPAKTPGPSPWGGGSRAQQRQEPLWALFASTWMFPYLPLIIQAIFTQCPPPPPRPNCLILFFWSFCAEDEFQELRISGHLQT